MRSRRALIALWAAVAVTSITLNGQSSGEQARNLQTLAVSGASNSTPSLAAEGRTVAAVWTATKDGSTNVYFAVSNDGGTIFSPPKQVNDQDGDAGATNEQPPRVTISRSGAGRHVHGCVVQARSRSPGHTPGHHSDGAIDRRRPHVFTGAIYARSLIFRRARVGIARGWWQRGCPRSVARRTRGREEGGCDGARRYAAQRTTAAGNLSRHARCGRAHD